jgi:hypothetical protein
MLISSAPYEPWPPRWIWPLAAAGAPLIWARWRWIGLLALAGLTPLTMRMSDAETHRFYLFWLTACAATGAGATRFYRHRWGRLLPFVLFAIGAASSIHAWLSLSQDRIEHSYGRSYGIRQAVQHLRAVEPAEGWKLYSGLGLDSDGAFRYHFEAAGLKHGSRPVALVHWDYMPALKGMQGVLVPMPALGPTSPGLFFPAPASLARLEAVSSQIGELHKRTHDLPPTAQREAALQALRDGTLKDPWARTVGWERWLWVGLQTSSIDPALLAEAAAEPLVSGWLFHGASVRILFVDPSASERLHKRALRADPRRKDLLYPGWR